MTLGGMTWGAPGSPVFEDWKLVTECAGASLSLLLAEVVAAFVDNVGGLNWATF